MESARGKAKVLMLENSHEILPMSYSFHKYNRIFSNWKEQTQEDLPAAELSRLFKDSVEGVKTIGSS